MSAEALDVYDILHVAVYDNKNLMQQLANNT